jgi:hypothetical protein
VVHGGQQTYDISKQTLSKKRCGAAKKSVLRQVCEQVFAAHYGYNLYKIEISQIIGE